MHHSTVQYSISVSVATKEKKNVVVVVFKKIRVIYKTKNPVTSSELNKTGRGDRQQHVTGEGIYIPMRGYLENRYGTCLDQGYPGSGVIKCVKMLYFLVFFMVCI